MHEAHGGYRPPALIEKLGEVHKNQRFALKPRRPERPKPAAAKAEAPKAEKAIAPATLALKWFFVATATGLAVSALLGLWMGLTHSRNRTLALGLMVAGALLPVVMLAL